VNTPLQKCVVRGRPVVHERELLPLNAESVVKAIYTSGVSLGPSPSVEGANIEALMGFVCMTGLAPSLIVWPVDLSTVQ